MLSDLGVIASDISDDIYINDEFSYILTVMNHGPDDATNITLVDTLPENVNFISVTSTQGHCIETNGVIECDLKNLPISETAMVTINVKAYSEGMAVNTASIFGDEEDPALINNNLTQYNQIERKLPNLTPYKLSNWDDKIIVSSNTGTFTNDAFIMAGKPVYIDYSYLNNGLAVAQRGYKINLYIDKTLVMTDTIEGDYEPNVYWYRYDYEYVFNNSGIFTIKIACDEENDLEESNEGDNEYSKTIYVNPKGGIIYNINFPAGWSMISLPVMPAKASVSSLFPEAKVVYGYEKGVGYVMVTKEEDLEFGRGYWILFDKAQNYSLTGQPIQSYNHNVFGDGWTMIGGCTSPARALGKSCSIGIIYGYAPGVGYKRVTESDKLQPGKGYWILFSHVMDQAGLTVETCP